MELLSILLTLAAVALGVVAIPTAATFVIGRANRAVWGIVTEAFEAAGQGAYRVVQVARRTTGRAPRAVVAAAWSSFFLGQWIIPGVLAILLLFLVMAELPWADNPTLLVSALSAPSGIALGGRLLGLGARLLSRDFGVEHLARRTARWTFVHNGVLIAAMVAAAILQHQEEATTFAVATVAWACLSIGHGALLVRAACAIEAHGQREWLPEALPPAA